MTGREHCALHSPESIEGRRRGGVGRSTVQRAAKRLPPDLRQVFDMLCVGVDDVRAGALQPTQLTAMASGAAAAIRVLEAALLVAEVETLQRQVTTLVQAQRALEGERSYGQRHA